MFAIGHTLVSEDLLQSYFVCDLSACKGACCVKGDAGAPLSEEEVGVLEDGLDALLPYMDDKGRATVARKGVFEMDVEGDIGTALNADGRCAFSTVAADGTVSCGIERAHAEGKAGFKKPVSCHLYPVRVREHRDFISVNYDRWDICQPACACGAALRVPLFRFLREALVRRFGQPWFAELEAVHTELVRQGRIPAP